MKILRILIDIRQRGFYNHSMKKSLILCFFCAAILFPQAILAELPDSPPEPDTNLSAGSAAQPAENPSEQAGQVSAEQPLLSGNKIVKAIEIKGNKTIGIQQILSKIKTRVGEEYLQSVISDDLKRLYNTGHFSDVSVDREDLEDGFKVIIYLVEKPIIEKVTFTRLHYFSPRKLLSKMQTKEGKFLDNKLLKDDIETIKETYVKKGLTAVTIDVETDIDKTTNKAKLHFIINEGFRMKVRRILVSGNEAFPDKRIIKVIKTRNAWILNAGFLKEDVLEEDMDRIKSFYEKEGFIDCQASYKTEIGKKGRVIVSIDVIEGQRYYVGSINIVGNKIATTDEVLKAMTDLKVGKPFSRDKLTLDIDDIRAMYFDKGYIFSQIRESTALNPETGKVDITLEVTEGDIAYVSKIRIQGNARTRDIVIRRELKIRPGDQFDGSKLRRSKERLKNLGFFEEIGYDIQDTDIPNKKDLVVEVKEAKTGTLSFGGGFSTIDQLIGFV